MLAVYCRVYGVWNLSGRMMYWLLRGKVVAFVGENGSGKGLGLTVPLE
jgi:ABC-type phosphonate transport system ATPase subunit